MVASAGDIIHVASACSVVSMAVLAVVLTFGPAGVMGPLMVAHRRQLGLWFLSGVATRVTDMAAATDLYMFARVANAAVGMLTAAGLAWALWRACHAAD